SFSSPYTYTLSDSSKTLSLQEDTYYWRVRAGNETGNWSNYSAYRVLTIDTTAPTMILSATGYVTDGGTHNAAVTMTFTSSESTNNFIKDDVSVTNASISSWSGSGPNYTATITPSSPGTVSIVVEASKFTDGAGNNNTTSNTYNWTHDATGPTMTLTSSTVSDGGTYNGPVTIKFT
ncbi:MAG: Ig-like domain-containing protein, partial [Acidobacteriota bacterium]|nr:Ig-like domain-containing protein [Acidobacteriota bacterium]